MVAEEIAGDLAQVVVPVHGAKKDPGLHLRHRDPCAPQKLFSLFRGGLPPGVDVIFRGDLLPGHLERLETIRVSLVLFGFRKLTCKLFLQPAVDSLSPDLGHQFRGGTQGEPAENVKNAFVFREVIGTGGRSVVLGRNERSVSGKGEEGQNQTEQNTHH